MCSYCIRNVVATSMGIVAVGFLIIPMSIALFLSAVSLPFSIMYDVTSKCMGFVCLRETTSKSQ